MEASTPTQSPEAEITLSGDGPDHERGPDDLSPGMLVGRYLIIGKIGAGAMGVVFAAYDPELDRKIALKLLHARGSATLDARARLLREAKSLARLSHPNVVAVHDVGTYGDHVFLAMEFVAGRTLTAWLKEQARRWPEIVEVLSRAGEGLAAAHDAGLVHRDFKPDNVLIGDDGRVRVLDFGLARAADAGDSVTAASDALAVLPSASISASRSRESEREAMLVTRTGALIGTPAYMSPEQHLGKAADPLSDQFSFCVTLYQALYGVRPFTATKMSALAFQIIQGKVEAAPAGTRVPTWLRKVVVRGLAIDPEQRHKSMRVLLAALHRDRGVLRRGAAAAAGLGGMGLGLGLWLASAEPPCEGAAQKLADVWDEARVEAIGRAFRSSKAPYAADIWASTRAAVTDYAEEWKEAYHDACAATHVLHEQSEHILDLRMRCLDRRLTRLAGLSASLLRPNQEVIERAIEGVSTLGDIEACKDKDTLLVVVPPPQDPGKVLEIEAQLADANALELAADLEPARERSAAAMVAATNLAYAPIEAEAQLVHARVLQRLGRHDDATRALEEAIRAASRGRDDHLAATAWIDLAFHTGAFQPDAVRLTALRLAAETAIARAGDDLWLRARLHHAVATGLQRLGRRSAALDLLLPALPILEQHSSRDSIRLQQALNTAGLIYREQGAFDAAQDAFERAIALSERLYGPQHPSVAAVRNNFAVLALERDDLAGAEELARAAADVFEKTLPEGHVSHALVASTLAEIAEKRGDLRGAEALLEKALALFRAHPDLHPMHAAEAFNDLAILADRQGDLERARDHFREALKLFRACFGADNVYARTVESNLVEISLALAEPTAALEIVDRLLATVPDAPPIAPPVPYLLSLRAQGLLALDRVAEAREAAERAVKLLDAGEGGATDAEEGAIVQATLARVLAVTDSDPARRERLVILATPVLKAATDNTMARRALAAIDNLSRGTAPSGRPSRPRQPG